MKRFRLNQIEKSAMDQFFQLLEGAKDAFKMALLDVLRLFLRYDGQVKFVIENWSKLDHAVFYYLLSYNI